MVIEGIGDMKILANLCLQTGCGAALHPPFFFTPLCHEAGIVRGHHPPHVWPAISFYHIHERSIVFFKIIIIIQRVRILRFSDTQKNSFCFGISRASQFRLLAGLRFLTLTLSPILISAAKDVCPPLACSLRSIPDQL